jgi:hypothetical protein
MLNWTSKLAFVSTLVFGTLSFAPLSLAGEGGIAGAASFNLDATGIVLEASVATAVGKTTAYGGAQTTTDGSGNITTEALAVGTGAEITFNGSDIFLDSISEESSSGLPINQGNTIDQTVDINAAGGTAIIDNN